MLRSREAVPVRRGELMPTRLLGWLCLAVVLVRGTYALQPLRSDEAGYLYIARQWHAGGEFLYGDFYVDRPPLLIAIFQAAALTDWDPMIRVLTIPFALHLMLERRYSVPFRLLAAGFLPLAIFVILLLAYMYYRSAADAQLAAIGLLAFAAVALAITAVIFRMREFGGARSGEP